MIRIFKNQDEDGRIRIEKQADASVGDASSQTSMNESGNHSQCSLLEGPNPPCCSTKHEDPPMQFPAIASSIPCFESSKSVKPPTSELRFVSCDEHVATACHPSLGPHHKPPIVVHEACIRRSLSSSNQTDEAAHIAAQAVLSVSLAITPFTSMNHSDSSSATTETATTSLSAIVSHAERKASPSQSFEDHMRIGNAPPQKLDSEIASSRETKKHLGPKRKRSHISCEANQYVDLTHSTHNSNAFGHSAVSVDAFSQPQSPLSKRESLPYGLRNTKMKATDCLLFAATLLEQNTSFSNMHNHPLAERNVERPASHLKIETAHSVANFPHSSTSAAKDQIVYSVDSPSTEMAPTYVNPSVTLPSPSTTTVYGEKKCKDAFIAHHQSRILLPPIANSEKIFEPKELDVLCGRGGMVNKHPGNVIFRRVVEFNKSYYQTVRKRNRILVSQSIVQAILRNGGRFLIGVPKFNTYWIPINFKKAVQKTSQALRECKKDAEDQVCDDGEKADWLQSSSNGTQGINKPAGLDISRC